MRSAVFCLKSAVIDGKGIFVFPGKSSVNADPVQAGSGDHTGKRLSGQSGGGVRCVQVFDSFSFYWLFHAWTAAEQVGDQAVIVGRICRRSRLRPAAKPGIKKGSVRLVHAQNFLYLFDVLIGKPERFFDEAVEFLPGDPDLRTEFIDGESAFLYITGQKKQKIFHINHSSLKYQKTAVL